MDWAIIVSKANHANALSARYGGSLYNYLGRYTVFFGASNRGCQRNSLALEPRLFGTVVARAKNPGTAFNVLKQLNGYTGLSVTSKNS